VNALPPCESCERPAKVRALYARRDGQAVLVGRYGPVCFYRAARDIAESGRQPEHQDARPIHLRGLQ
jgi:hypothetical protein